MPTAFAKAVLSHPAFDIENVGIENVEPLRDIPVPEGMKQADFVAQVDVDACLETVDELSNEEIVQCVKSARLDDNVHVDDSDTEIDIDPPPSAAEALYCLQRLRRFFQTEGIPPTKSAFEI